MSYGGDPEFTGKSVATINQQKQQALAKQEQIQRENEALQQQRARAPGTVARGSPQEVSIRQQEAQAAQQRMVAENIHQVGYSSDLFAQEREAAIKSGKFDYSSVRSAFYSPPPTYVTSKGQTVTRTPTPPPPPSGPPRDLTTLTTRVTQPTPKPTPSVSGAAIDISSAQLARTDALRAQMGLPPLEQAEKVTVVKGTQTQPVKPIQKPTTELDYRLAAGAAMSQAQGIPEKMQGGEAVSFLTFPFERTLAKTPLANLFRPPPPSTQTGTKEVPATGIVDVLQFVPLALPAEELVSAGKALVATGRELPTIAANVLGKGIAGKGIIEVPKGVKPAEETISGMISRMFSGEKPIPSTPTETPIELGTGLGKVISKGGEAGKPTDVFSKPPPETPTISKPSTTEKTIPSGKGQELVLKEKVTEPEPLRDEAMQKYKDTLTGKGGKTKLIEEQTFLRTPEDIPKTPTKTGAIEIPVPILTPPTQGEIVIPLLTPKPTERPTMTGGYPILTQEPKETTIPILTPKPTERQITTGGGYPIFSPPPTITTTTTTTITNTTEEPPPTKKTPPDLLGFGLGGSLTGGGGRGEGSGTTKTFLGNVPTESIIGVYKESDITYGERAIQSTSQPKEGKTFYRTLGRGDILTSKGETIRNTKERKMKLL